MNTDFGISTATNHTRRAAERFKDWAALKSYVQKQKAQKTGIQIGVSAVFGLFLLVWAEVSLYLAFASNMKPWAAALIVMGVNLLIVGGANLAIGSWKRKVKNSEDRASQAQLHRGDYHDKSYDDLSAPDAVLRAERNRHEARLELLAAKSDLVDSANAFVRERIVEPANRYVVAPVTRYRYPIAFAGTFAVGLLVARAVLPRHKRLSRLNDDIEREVIEITDVRSLV